MILYFKNKLPSQIKKSIKFIFNFEVSKEVAFLVITILLGTQDVLRTSTQWTDPLFVNEVGTIDFVNFGFPPLAVGEMMPGEVDNPMSFGVRESQANEQPFILTQAPNFVTPPVDPPVGGEFLGVDSTALLVTGAQMNAAWLIPILVSAIGIGIVVAKKLRN